MEDTIFTKIVKGEIPCAKVYEDEKTFAFLDISPVNKGHTLVIPKKQVEKFHELDDEDAEALMRTVQKVAQAVAESFGPDYNIINNNGASADQIVPHVHFHIIPRKDKSEINLEWSTTKYEEGEQDKVLEKLKANLS
ncbi:HIT family protein [Candidatus Woesearchaeota archaeon]|nr:HIT family protein [Candidatus Woesearchaeota archaeon]